MKNGFTCITSYVSSTKPNTWEYIIQIYAKRIKVYCSTYQDFYDEIEKFSIHELYQMHEVDLRTDELKKW